MRPKPKPKRRVWVLLLGLVTILAWQHGFTSNDAQITDEYRVTASSGRQYESSFFFMLYHLGVYPLLSAKQPKADTDEAARALLREDAATLFQESGLTFRSGDLGRVYLFYPDVWVHHDSRNPHLWAADIWLFTFALSAVFFASWWVRRPLLGAMIVAFFGSDPFQLYSAYREDNYFSLPITAMLLVLALNLPAFAPENKRSRALLLIPVLTGVVLALFRTVRGEPSILLLPACLIWLTATKLPRDTRGIMLMLGLFSFTVGNVALDAALKHKFMAARELVRDEGGSPFTGPIVLHHEIWHPIWCGLGDYDMKYGANWSDTTAYYRVRDQVEHDTGHTIGANPNHWRQEELWSDDARYPKTFFEAVPNYHEVIRKMVVDHVRKDPGWYADILEKRLRRINNETTPLSLRVGSWVYARQSTHFGVMALCVFGTALLMRRWFYLKLALFALPLSATSLLVYSGGHTTSYSVYHLMAAVIFSMIVYEKARGAWRDAGPFLSDFGKRKTR